MERLPIACCDGCGEQVTKQEYLKIEGEHCGEWLTPMKWAHAVPVLEAMFKQTCKAARRTAERLGLEDEGDQEDEGKAGPPRGPGGDEDKFLPPEANAPGV